ncbi:MAG: NAD(P)/FAD-dependent oxidoreductase [Planctomycetes bacterium]|nr:NAD(P)/FAD-dependent oxidoreductase [Planctomycetota bacterium]
MKRLLILGGGTAGTRVANAVAKRRPDVSVTVADSHGDHLYQPANLYIPFGIDFETRRDARALLRESVVLRVERASRIDAAARTVHFESGVKVEYDALVIATGSRTDHDAIPGLSEAGHHFHCEKSARALKDALALFEGGKVIVGASRLPYKCPPSPIEFTLLLDERLREQGVRTRTEIHYVYPLPRVMSLAPVADAVDGIFKDRGIKTATSFETESADPEKRTIRAADGRVLPFDLLVMVPPHCGAPFLAESGFAGPGNWVKADKETMRVADGIYALGDAADLPVPKSGAAAHYQSDVVVENVLAEIDGGAPAAKYDGRVQCFCETGKNQALKIEFTYATPPERPKTSYLAHHQKAILNRLYFSLIPHGWL